MASAKNSPPTQDFVNVKAVQNGVLVLKNGALRQILLVSGINFDLKSEDEQNAIIAGYQGFLNSLNFSIQIFVHSRKVNVAAYLENLKKIEVSETNPLLQMQIAEYGSFIKEFTGENAIMQKSFFVVVPYDPVSIPGTGGGTGGLLGMFKKKGKEAEAQQAADVAERFQEKAGQLAQRTDQIVSGLTQLGLRAVPLGDQELTELLYNLYNPESVEKKGLRLGEQPDAAARA
jgi:type IV secretory pathway VirB4 component